MPKAAAGVGVDSEGARRPRCLWRGFEGFRISGFKVSKLEGVYKGSIRVTVGFEVHKSRKNCKSSALGFPTMMIAYSA